MPSEQGAASPPEVPRASRWSWLHSQGLGLCCGQAAVLLLAIGSVVLAATRDGASAAIEMEDLRGFFRPAAFVHIWLYLLIGVFALWALNTLLATWRSVLARVRGGVWSPAAWAGPVIHVAFLVGLLAHGVGGLWSEEGGAVVLGPDFRDLEDGRRARVTRVDVSRLPDGGLEQVHATVEVADAGVEVADAGVEVADAGVEVADAGVEVADAGVEVADAGVEVADAGVEVADAGVEVADAGVEVADAGVEVADAGVEVADAGVEVADAGVEVADAGVEVADAGVEVADAGVEVAGATGAVEPVVVAYNRPLSRGWGSDLLLLVRPVRAPGPAILSLGAGRCVLDVEETCLLGGTRVTLLYLQHPGRRGGTPLAHVRVKPPSPAPARMLWLAQGSPQPLGEGALALEGTEPRLGVLMRRRYAPGTPLALLASVLLALGLLLLAPRLVRGAPPAASP